MDLEQQRQNFQKYALKIELPTERHVFSVMLHWDFMRNRNEANILLSRHYHIRYEVLCLWNHSNKDANATFKVIPPHTWHPGRSLQAAGEDNYITSFQFYVTNRQSQNDEPLYSPNSVLNSFLLLDTPVEIADTFGGNRMLHDIWHELDQQENRSIAKINALFQLLMINLAMSLPVQPLQKPRDYKYLMSDFYPEIIERYLTDNYPEPDCSRERLAKLLCISDRQLGRVLEQMYHKTFRELLLEYRMEFAESWRQRGLTAQQTAQKVGYQSLSGFRKAYKQYHNTPFKAKTDKT